FRRVLFRSYFQLKLTVFLISGCRLKNTGQVIAARSKMVFDFSSATAFISNETIISLIFLGSACIIFVTSAVESSIRISIAFALIPIMLNIQVASEFATISVGEKASPRPWLSVRASVKMIVPECKWVDSVLKSPLYITLLVLIILLL